MQPRAGGKSRVGKRSLSTLLFLPYANLFHRSKQILKAHQGQVGGETGFKKSNMHLERQKKASTNSRVFALLEFGSGGKDKIKLHAMYTCTS